MLKSSSKTSEIRAFTPTFSSSATWEEVSKMTLSGWNAIGLDSKVSRDILHQVLDLLTQSSVHIAVA
jgi:hypothetical protein